jgi:hypothetical protein
MAIMDALGDATSKVKKAYKTGDDESSGLGKELQEKARNIKDVSDSMSSQPAKPASKTPSKPAAWEKVNKGSYGSGAGEKSPASMNAKYPDLPKLHKGGMVTKTGPHMLLKGEAVLSKQDTKKMSALGGQANAEPSDQPDGMSIEKVDDGSFHITHRHDAPKDGGPMPEAKKYSARNLKHLVRHVKQHFGGGQQDDGMAEPSSFADGGVVEKSGMAMVHKGEKVTPAAKAPVKTPDIFIGGKKSAPAPIKPAPNKSLDPLARDREQSLT